MNTNPDGEIAWKKFVEEVSRNAYGNWEHILEALGIPSQFLDRRKNGPCPVCSPSSGFNVNGKKSDRFRFDDRTGNGDYVCRNPNHGSGGGFKLLMGYHSWGFAKTAHEVNDYLGGIAFKEYWAKESTSPKFHGHIHDEDTPEKREKRLKWVRKAWWGAKPLSKGDPVDVYLRGRGIELDSFPPSLRYHPALEYTETVGKPGGGDEHVKLGTYPAMLAEVVDADGNLLTVHRTYLDPDGDGKAKIFSSVDGEEMDVKKVMCRSHGGVVRLFPIPENGVLGTSEGIETAFGAYLRTGVPVWPALNAPGFKSMPIPSEVHTLLIFADNDAPDQHGRRAGQEAALELAERARSEGKTVKVYIPPKEGMDFLDVYLEHRQQKPS